MAWGNQSASSSNCQGCNLCLKKMTFQYCFDGSIKKVNNLSVSSPRTWGCFGSRQDDLRQQAGLPHARGGVSASIRKKVVVCTSSPRTWGCFPLFRHNLILRVVFPTHVGVFLTTGGTLPSTERLPHARGGVSSLPCPDGVSPSSSPRTWGCFQIRQARNNGRPVFPTHVGVFLDSRTAKMTNKGLPHARGGVSRKLLDLQDSIPSSPRTWGCFRRCKVFRLNAVVFPTHVGVFLVLAGGVYAHGGLPHARGGVSTNRTRHRRTYPSSPRTWGCF